MKAASKKKAPVVSEEQYLVTLKLGSEVLEGAGATIGEAFRAIKEPVKIVTKSVLTVKKGDKQLVRALTVPLCKRLFYPSSQIYYIKSFENVLK